MIRHARRVWLPHYREARGEVSIRGMVSPTIWRCGRALPPPRIRWIRERELWQPHCSGGGGPEQTVSQRPSPTPTIDYNTVFPYFQGFSHFWNTRPAVPARPGFPVPGPPSALACLMRICSSQLLASLQSAARLRLSHVLRHGRGGTEPLKHPALRGRRIHRAKDRINCP